MAAGSDRDDSPLRRAIVMRYRTRRTHAVLLTAIPVVLLLALGIFTVRFVLLAEAADWSLLVLPAVGTGAAALLTYAVYGIIAAHIADLDRMKEDLDLAATTGRLPARWRQFTGGPGEIAGLSQAVERAFIRRHRHRSEGAWIAGVLAGIPAAVIVFTGTGLVALSNAAARRRLGEFGTSPGHSIFTIVDHGLLDAALRRARESKRPVEFALSDTDGNAVEAQLAGLAEGGVISFLAPAEDVLPEQTAMDLSLGAAAPMPMPFLTGTPLTGLPVVSLDLETTGLEASRDRIVSIGAVRVQGGHVFTGASLDILVNPGIPIPERSFQVHGISDELVAGAPPLPELWEELNRFCAGCVIVGHQIGFDLAVLAAEAKRHGLPAFDVPALDTMALFKQIAPDERIGLDSAAEAMGLSVFGRHTALGDAIVTAELFNAMVPELESRGIADYGRATEIAAPRPWGRD
ncbi:3'-5' exonuclease [Nisaea acidiphila]|uniref:DNA-directed DNA polymerase n=1 Tax=Nisaea acidiphila TaxID=1862145 RepID=A0A9J7AQ95_9PROT|nr:3'-5' exonuclease [Nisaea acidiphila]UUX49066.1 3'-5' exonuclease [Nisaea acidiphila]